MNKVTTINLNGRAYQLEERGFDALRRYLDTAAAKLAGNLDKDEIMADFEQAIADKFDQKLSPAKNVISEKEVDDIIAAMGPVEGEDESATASASGSSSHSDGSDNSNRNNSGTSATSGGGTTGTDTKTTGVPKRLYRISQGEWLMGVCNGLAAYFNVDVTLMRIIWILLAILTHGFWIAAYIILAIVIPPVRTEEEYSQAHGWTTRAEFSAHDFIEEAKKYYAQLQKMHEEHVAEEAAKHGWKTGDVTGTKNSDGTMNESVGATAGASTVAASASAAGASASASATAESIKHDVKQWKHKFRDEMRAKKKQMKQEWREKQREWRQHGHGWRDGYGAGHMYQNGPGYAGGDYNGRNYGPGGPGYGISRAIFGFFAVLVSIVLFVLGVAWVFALYTLIAHGTVFGFAIGAGQPLWVPIVFLCAAFYILAVPFRILIHHAWGDHHYHSGFGEFLGFIVFIAVCVALVWSARELFPQVNALWNTAAAWLASKR